MTGVPTAGVPGGRTSAAKVAKWLVDRARVEDAIMVLSAYACTGPSDAEGQALLAEALRLDPASPVARQAFERMEGMAGNQPLLDDAIARFDRDALARLERELQPKAGFRRAQVGFNNNVKYNGRVFHVQTEDSGLDKPHIITHLFADGGRIIKTHRRNYHEHVQRDDVALFVRALMKGQHMEMLLMLREGRFDSVIEGKTMGGIDVLVDPPNVDIKRLGKKKNRDTSAGEITVSPSSHSLPAADEAPPPESEKAPPTVADPSPPSAIATSVGQVLFNLVVQRSLGGGPEIYSVRDEEAIIGRDGLIRIADPFVHPREAAFRFRQGRLWLEDFEGGNGAFLRIRSRVELTPGDEFVVGDQLFRVEKNPVADDWPEPDPTYFYSSPKWPSSFRVVQIFEGGALGACVVSSSGIVQVGSAIGDIVCPHDPLLSEQHCVLEEQADVVVLTDLDSRTGVFVRLQGEGELLDGDEILVGRTRLLVDLPPWEAG